MAEITKERNYYWRWLVQIGRQARADVRELVVGLIIALAILLLQVHNGTVLVTDFRLDAISTFWPYVTATILYVVYATFRAPLELDRELAKEIDQLKEAIPPPVTVTFEKLEFTLATQGSTRTCNMSLNLRFSSGKEPATLHNFRLRSELPNFKNFSDVAKYVYGHSPSHGSHVIALGSNDVRHARLVFDFGVTGTGLVQLSDPEIAWCLEFEDSSKRYSERIPEKLYTAHSEAADLSAHPVRHV